MDLRHEPTVTERFGHYDGYDYGYDVTGQAYQYERYMLPNPHMPELPHARVPLRPAHPLQGYADAREYYAYNGGMLSGHDDHAVPMQKGIKYPDQQPGPEFM